MKQKKRIIIELIILSLVVLLITGYFNLFWVKKQIAHYYYEQATKVLEEEGLQPSGEYLIKAIDWDPELNSQEFKDFKQYRDELFSMEGQP